MHIDRTPLILRCGTRLYRAVFTDKQARYWYSRDYPSPDCPWKDVPFDIRTLAGSAQCGEEELLLKVRKMTYHELRQQWLVHKLSKSHD